MVILNFQIQAAVYALRSTRGLAWPNDHKKKEDDDILDWLQVMFGFQVKKVNVILKKILMVCIDFHVALLLLLNDSPTLFHWGLHSVCFSFSILQKDNVSNQREHLILLLANVHIRQSKPDQQPRVFFSSLFFFKIMQMLLTL